jgi:hypothetical protein
VKPQRWNRRRFLPGQRLLKTLLLKLALREQMENNEKVNALKSKAQSAFDSMEDALEGF